MATYPGGVKSFAVIADGDVVQADDPNDIQSEVTAIEDALLNGIAHHFKPVTNNLHDLGASGQAFRDLWLTRNATVGGTLGVTGIATFLAAIIASDDIKLASLKKLYLDGGGDTYLAESAANIIDIYTNAVKALTINAQGQLSSPTQFNWSVYHNTTQALVDSVAASLSMNSEDFDVTTMHDTAVNNTRVTIPAGGDGKYCLIGQVAFAANATGVRSAFFKKNGATSLNSPSYSGNASAVVALTTAIVSLVAGDYIELWAVQNSGGGLNVGNATRESGNIFQGFKMVNG